MFEVTLKVRDEAKLARFASPLNGMPGVDVASWVSGRISRVPIALPVPVANQLLRMSSRAMVRPGSMLNVVCWPWVMPLSPLGVKVS